jgi:hypothetical protein
MIHISQGFTCFILLLALAFATDSSRLEEISESPLPGFANNKVKIAAWAVNGIRALINKEALQNFIEHEKPDIL